MSRFDVRADDGTLLNEGLESLQEALDAGQSSRQAGEVRWFRVVEIEARSGHDAVRLTSEVAREVFDSRATELQ
ncbi:MAG: hypothetical protein QOH95_368 [Gaiellaceae bacterium]|jgi:hypothetical protein|nr:hypothetical protein [Gaiellaceae bacterium]